MHLLDNDIFIVPVARKCLKAVRDLAGLKAVIEHKHRFQHPAEYGDAETVEKHRSEPAGIGTSHFTFNKEF